MCPQRGSRGGSGGEVPGPPQTCHEEPGWPKKVDRHNNLHNEVLKGNLFTKLQFIQKND